MKKILVLSFVLLFAVGAMAQELYIYYGFEPGGPGEDASNPVNIGVDKWVDIPVYFMGTEDIVGEAYCVALSFNNAYADMMDTLAGYVDEDGTIFQWDSYYFANFVENSSEVQTYYGTSSTWDCYSHLGFCDPNPPYNAPSFTSLVPELNIHWVIHTIDDTLLIEESTCELVGAGYDPMQFWPRMSDESGNINYDTYWESACYYFSPNQPVVPSEYVESGTVPECTYEDFSITVAFDDPDGDEPEVTTTAGTITLTDQIAYGEEGMTFVYTVDFDMENYCGQCFDGNVTVTATDPNNPEEPAVYDAGDLVIIGQMTASMDPALYIWPGMEDWMPVYLDVCGDCFCLGAFVFTMEWDASVLSVTDVMQGTALNGGEYWNVNLGVEGDGTLRVTFINDLNNQTPVEEICGLLEDPIFYVKFLLSADYEYPTNFCIPICFMDEGYEYNNVSDDGGYHVWMVDGCDDAPDSSEYGTLDLVLECGNVKVMDEHNVELGDLNLNGYPCDAGDVVLLANHLIDSDAYPFTLRQMYASDVNGDDVQASIADLIYMINVLNGDASIGKLAPLDVVATISMPTATVGDLDVSVNSEAAVGGVAVEIAHAGVELGVPTCEGMDIDYSDNGEVMNVIVYSMESQSFASGTNALFTVPVVSEGAVTINDVQISDSRGALLDAKYEITAPTPEVFSVNQNFPNPFNAKTSIAFGLPTDADVTINIYNVAGQLVESMDMGYVQAGRHSVVWDASEVASGVYFYKVSAGSYNETMKMTLLK